MKLEAEYFIIALECMKNPYILLFRETWKYAKGKRLLFVLYYLCFIIGSSLIMLQPVFFGLFLNTIQLGGEDMLFWLTLHLGAYAFLNFAQWAFHGPARLMEQQVALHVEQQFADDSYRKLMELPLRWHKDHHSGETVSRIQKAGKALRGFVDQGFMFLEMVTRAIAGLIALLFIHVFIGSFALAMGLLTLLVILAFDKKFVPQMQAYNNQEHSVHSLLFDYINNAVTVLILRLRERTRTAVQKRYQGLLPYLKAYTRTNEGKWFSVGMIVAITELLALLFYCVTQLQQGEMLLVGTIVILAQYLERFIMQFYNFTWQYGDVVQRYSDFTSITPMWEDHTSMVGDHQREKISRTWNTIDIQNASFAYKGEEANTTLNNISLHIERGKKYALVGESGSGKSTLLTILRGIEQTDTGTIEIDKKAYSSTQALAEISTLCPQDPEIFENTIEYNITVDIPCSKKELEEMLHASRFSSVVERLPNGLQTDIKEKGVNLSGGEKQRLALARGLFAAKNSSLLLLDEPTSSVDPKNEKAIYKEIFALHTKSAVVSSIHRLHLLPLFDYVYVFDKGRIVEEGTFEELCAGNGNFTQLWKQYQHTLGE